LAVVAGCPPGTAYGERPRDRPRHGQHARVREWFRGHPFRAERRGGRPGLSRVCPVGSRKSSSAPWSRTTKAAGAKTAFLIEEPMAAAIGAGLPVHEPTGVRMVDIGGGTTEVAVISFGGIVASTSLRVAGDTMDTFIINQVRKTRGLAIGERPAEALKTDLGSAFPLVDEETAEARGRDMASGFRHLWLSRPGRSGRPWRSQSPRSSTPVRDTLDRCPPELAGDIIERGVVLTGGGALLRGLDDRLREEILMPVTIANDSLSCVAVGAGRCLENFPNLREVLLAHTEPAI
jgi:rod shape-determining protein MreB